MPKEWLSLTRRGQARRLLELARHAMEQYDLKVRALRLLVNAFNCTFRVETDSGNFALRINRPNNRTLQEIDTEMDWLAALSRDTALIVPTPVPTKTGALSVIASADGVPEERICALFQWLPGPLISESITPEWFYKLGSATAQLHAHAEQFTPLHPDALRSWTTLYPFADHVVLYRDPRLMPPERREVFQETERLVQQALDRRAHDRRILLHADLHTHNLKGYRGRLGIFDFDDCMFGYPVQDAGITMFYVLRQPHYPELLAAYREGYESQRPWLETYPGELDAFIAGRSLILANYMLIDFPERAEQFMERMEARLREFIEHAPNHDMVGRSGA